MDNPLVKMGAPAVVLLSTHLTKLKSYRLKKKKKMMGLQQGQNVFIELSCFSGQASSLGLSFPTNFFLPLEGPQLL